MASKRKMREVFEGKICVGILSNKPRVSFKDKYDTFHDIGLLKFDWQDGEGARVIVERLPKRKVRNG